MLAGDDEALHQMRVALRRLRAAMSVFEDVVGDRRSSRIKTELRWLASALGPARDLDVLFTELLAPMRRLHHKHPGIQMIHRELEARRVAAHEDAIAAVRSRRYRLLTRDVLAWIEAESRESIDRPIVPHAAKELSRRRRKLRTGGRPIRALSAGAKHRLRINVKKLRYAMEFFSDLYSKREGRRCKKALSALASLQDALGALNDVATREALASHIVAFRRANTRRSAAVEKAFAAGVIYGTEEAQVGGLLHEAQAAYRKFFEIKPFWN